MTDSKFVTAKPAGFEDVLADEQVVGFDSYSGKPVTWGYPIIRHLGEGRFADLRRIATVDCVSMSIWVVVTRRLTHEEAIQQYGVVANTERGPRGGFRSRTYGTTRFACDLEST